MEHELDGMAAVVDGVAKQVWPHTIDAAVWAEKFCEQYPEMDKGVMLGWFANAIMAGYDTACSRMNGALIGWLRSKTRTVSQCATEQDCIDHNEFIYELIAELERDVSI